MRMTQAEVNAFLARTAKRQVSSSESAVAVESELHGAILEECKRRGWIAFHGSMAHSTYRTLGEPDFQILADGGRMFLIECKTKTGKLTTDQLAVMAWASKLGHRIHVVRSLPEFMQIVSLYTGQPEATTEDCSVRPKAKNRKEEE